MNIFLDVLMRYFPPRLMLIFIVVLGGAWMVGQLATEFKTFQEVDALNWNPQVWADENHLGFGPDQKSLEELRNEKDSPFSSLNGIKQDRLLKYWKEYVEQAEKTFLIGEFREKYGIGVKKTGEGAGKGTVLYPTLLEAERGSVLRHLTPAMRAALVEDEKARNDAENARNNAIVAQIKAKSIENFDPLAELMSINVGVGQGMYQSLDEAGRAGRLKGRHYTTEQVELLNKALRDMSDAKTAKAKADIAKADADAEIYEKVRKEIDRKEAEAMAIGSMMSVNNMMDRLFGWLSGGENLHSKNSDDNYRLKQLVGVRLQLDQLENYVRSEVPDTIKPRLLADINSATIGMGIPKEQFTNDIISSVASAMGIKLDTEKKDALHISKPIPTPSRFAKIQKEGKFSVRREPKEGDNKICALPTGAVVGLLDHNPVKDESGPNGLTFVQVTFTRQGGEKVMGWLSEKVLAQLDGTNTVKTGPQVCEAFEPVATNTPASPQEPHPDGTPAPAKDTPSAVKRLARIKTVHPQILVRREPKTGDNGICSVADGVIVNLVDEGGSHKAVMEEDGTGKPYTFVHVRFKKLEGQTVTGWINEKVLEEFDGTEPQGSEPQACAPIMPETRPAKGEPKKPILKVSTQKEFPPLH